MWNYFRFNLFWTCVISNDTKATTFVITATTLHVPVVTLSSQDDTKVLEQLKSVLKRTMNRKEN